MGLSGIQPRHSRIGVDIGASGVRAVQLMRSGSGYTVRVVARNERSVEASAAVEPSLEHRLTACLKGGDFRGRRVAAGVRAAEVEYHLIELPGAVAAKADHDTDQAVRWEVASLMGDSVENVEARYWIVPPPSAPGPNTFAVGTRTRTVQATYDACVSAGTTCTAIDAPASALCRVATALRPPAPRSVWGVLDLGFDQTRLVLCVDEAPVMVRNVGPGGNGLTMRIAETLRISEKAAEIHKREHGITPASRGSRGEEASDAASRELGAILYGAIRSDLNGIAEETKRSFRYVADCYAGRETDGLLIVGGGAQMKRLPELLHGQVGVRVYRPSDCLSDSSCRLQYSSGRGDALEPLALAVGLALPD